MKNIILLSDGTGNSAAKVWRTNVWRLFQSLDLKSSKQIAIYDDGVGTSSFLPLAILGGAFGYGLKRNVLDLYKFLCRNYQPGDKIYGFGFSRGAFTIRVVTGLVLNQGLVVSSSEGDLDKKARAAYRAYRYARYPARNLAYPFLWIRHLLDKSFYIPQQRTVGGIEFLGLWDTVAAYGLPVDEMTRGVNKWILPLELPNTEFNPKIQKARHALAIDDERDTFHPVLWDEDATNTKPAGSERETKDEKLLQVWFVGMHANVGGGYPDDSLANVSLSWILAEARQAGLVFKDMAGAEPDALLSTDSAKDKDGRLYDSRSGIGAYYRYNPRKITDFYEAMRKAAENRGKAPGALLPKIHESVFGRIKIGAHMYAPIGLPPAYEVVKTGDVSLVYTPPPPVVTPDPLAIVPNTRPLSEGSTSFKRHVLQEDAWDLVWRRRVVYFLTVFATGYLLAYPLFRDTYAFEELRTRLRIVSDTIRIIGSVTPSFATRWLDAYAREPAWFLVTLGLVIALTVMGTGLAGKIRDTMRRIWVIYLPGSNRSPIPGAAKAPALYSKIILGCVALYLTLYPVIDRFFPLLKIPGRVGDILAAYTAPPICCVLGVLLFVTALPQPMVRALRTSSIYQAAFQFLKQKLLPFVSAFGLLFLTIELGAHYVFNLFDGLGAFCPQNPSLMKSHDGFDVNGNSHQKEFPFDTSPTVPSSICISTGLFVKTGVNYKIDVTRAPGNENTWTFFGEPSYMGGQPISRLPWYKELTMAALFPLRRSLDRPWGAFVLRIGGKGNEEDFLDRDPPAQSDDFRADPKGFAIPKNESLGETLKPKRDGELFVYLNKPIFWVDRLIGNAGTAKITVTYTER